MSSITDTTGGLPMQPIMLELLKILAEHNKIGEFTAAVQYALTLNLEELTELGIQTYAQYLAFMNSLLSWTPIEHKDGHWIYKNLCVFAFVFNCPPLSTDTDLQTLISPKSSGLQLKPITQWLVDYANAMGGFMNSTQSWNQPGQVQSFQSAPIYRLERYNYSSATTFNEFFSRTLITPNPVDGASDNTVIASPADCTFASYGINIGSSDTVTIKTLEWSLDDLLATSSYHNAFAGGTFVHAFLAPFDYHRQHAPVSGKVVEKQVIPGQCYLEVDVESVPGSDGHNRLRPRRPIFPHSAAISADGDVNTLSAPDNAGYQFLQARGVIIIDTTGQANIGYVAIIPVGMCQVSSVQITVSVGDTVNKGDPISYFQLGGSDVIMVFEQQANFQLLQTILDNIQVAAGSNGAIAYPGNHYTQGQQINKSANKYW
jgi:phosphatidylserine decarboxylase